MTRVCGRFSIKKCHVLFCPVEMTLPAEPQGASFFWKKRRHEARYYLMKGRFSVPPFSSTNAPRHKEPQSANPHKGRVSDEWRGSGTVPFPIRPCPGCLGRPRTSGKPAGSRSMKGAPSSSWHGKSEEARTESNPNPPPQHGHSEDLGDALTG